jgi:hypothetical protein
VEFTVGRRLRGVVPPSRIASVSRVGWRDVPAQGTPGYFNATKPAEPNVLVAFTGEVPLVVMGATRNCRVLCLHLDEPEAAVAALGAAATRLAMPAGVAFSLPRTPERVR